MAKRQQVAVKKAQAQVVKRPHAKNGSISVQSLYNAKTHKKIIENAKKGRSMPDCSLLAGLGRGTLEAWIYKGRHEPDKYPHFAQLVADYEMAQAEFRGETLDNIVTVAQSQAPGTWQANAWLLERTDPENWGKKDRIEHVGDGGGPRTQLNTVVLIDSDAREAARDLLTRVAGNAGTDESLGLGSRLQLEAGDP